MKYLISAIFLCLFLLRVYGKEEVLLDYQLKAITWNGVSKSVPAGEYYSVKISSLPPNTYGVKFVIYDSKNKKDRTAAEKANKSLHPNPIDKGDCIGVFTQVVSTGPVQSITVNVDTKLFFRRNYYIVVESLDNAGVSLGNSGELRVYTGIKEERLSRFSVYGSIGAASFWGQNGSGIDVNPVLITGVKIHWSPVIQHEYIGRYSYKKCTPHWSVVIGTATNELYYKSTTIAPLIIGFRPVVGIDCELNKFLGISGGAIFGLQELESPFVARGRPIVGTWLTISLSADIFNQLKGQGTQGANSQPE